MRLVLAALLLVMLVPAWDNAYAKTLTIVTLEAPPLEYSEEGHPTGINVELARIALKRMGYEARFLFVPWRRALDMVETGNADAVLDAGWNAERAAFLHYPEEPIYLEEIYAFKLAERALSLDADLGNAARYVLGAGRGHYYGYRMDTALKDGTFKRVEFIGDVELNIDKLLARRIDMFLGVRVPFEVILRERRLTSEIDIVPRADTGEPYLLGSSRTYLAFSKAVHSDLIAKKTSAVLKKMREEGVVERVVESYR